WKVLSGPPGRGPAKRYESFVDGVPLADLDDSRIPTGTQVPFNLQDDIARPRIRAGIRKGHPVGARVRWCGERLGDDATRACDDPGKAGKDAKEEPYAGPDWEFRPPHA